MLQKISWNKNKHMIVKCIGLNKQTLEWAGAESVSGIPVCWDLSKGEGILWVAPVPAVVLKSITQRCSFVTVAAVSSCGSSWILHEVFPECTESASWCLPCHPVALTPTSPLDTSSSCLESTWSSLGPRSMWFPLKFKDTSSGGKQPILRGLSQDPWCASLET